jgi:glycerol-3-phosphate acyltransferase PlsY
MVSVALATVLLSGALGYLSGSIPFGLLIACWACGVDPRLHGSGNIGATNVARLCGWRWGLLVLLLDSAKGALPTWAAGQLGQVLLERSHGPSVASTLVSQLDVAAGAGAILGHLFPVWLGFRGGKGGATGLGVGVVLAPVAAAAAATAYLVVLVGLRYSSLGTLTATVIYVVTYLLGQRQLVAPESWARTLAIVSAAVLIFWKHRNIRRLWRGEEKRLVLWSRGTPPP